MASSSLFLRAVATLLAVAAYQTHLCAAALYKVGDASGWTTIGNVDYKQWSALKNFKVGDVILFQYNAQFHNVMQVTHAEYKACNTTSPKVTYTTGNDSITITTRGHHYFFCGVPGHCQAGQKVDINVPRIRASAPAQAPAAESSGTSSPSVPASGVQGPSPNVGVALKAGGKLELLALGAVLAVYYSVLL